MATSSLDDTGPANTNRSINKLCNTCWSAFVEARDKFDIFKNMYSNCDGSKILVLRSLAKQPCTHHDSFQKLKTAASSGCHLCSLIELYCRGTPLDSDLPLVLKFDFRGHELRRYAFGVKVKKEHIKIKLGLKSFVNGVPPQQAEAYYDSEGGIPADIFDMIGDWLKQCTTGHTQCSDGSTTRMPTRLVQVGTHDAPTVRLLRTQGIHAPYLTLSHCWGNADIKKRTTEGDFDIPLEQLPRTFQDAITVTRRLGFAYLWIDSLCIIQGDEADWENESANMASVYANGTLNLAATYSTDSHGGLMLERDHLQVTSCY
ncbi:hypothetical protein NM208_g850 [Fusarium decemcellulare]|uniref:Uncharacterized protein n=1 Tax=Fusarium decemcellulare TaxID=57161 RepID=A0ACC1SYA8_9HYPO|nr:hypothetical protein NM208_g850 [Fusarium decemcellulare]